LNKIGIKLAKEYILNQINMPIKKTKRKPNKTKNTPKSDNPVEGPIKTILIIDDEKAAGEELSEILKDEGYKTIIANNNAQARKIIGKISFDLVLLDLNLPDGYGLDLVGEIRAVGQNIYIIVITGHSSLESAIRAMREELYDYITKPFNPKKLIETIKTAFAKQIVGKKLQDRVIALEQFQKVAKNREFKMIELKQEIKQLKDEFKKIK